MSVLISGIIIEFPEDYALAEAENYEDSAIYTAEAEEIPEEAGADDKDIPEDEPAAAVEEEPADIDTADSEGNDEYTQSEESVVEEEEVKEDKKRRKGLFGIFSKK